MPEVDARAEHMRAWSFEPDPLDPVRLESAPLAKLSPLTRAIGNASARLMAKEENFEPSQEGYWEQSILLHTPQGPVHYYRVASRHHHNGSLAVEYPDSVGKLPDELFSSVLGVEAAKLHNDFPNKDAEQKERRLIGSWRFPEPDQAGRHTWLEEKVGTIVHYSGPFLRQTAVINGVLGEIHVPKIRSISLERGRYHGYVEEEPRKINVATVNKHEKQFKRLALAVASHMGGANQISSETHESSPYLLSYHAMGTDHNQSAAWVIPKLAMRGYDVKEYQRTPGKNVDRGFKVLIATKPASGGTETLAVYEGLSTFWYTRGARNWQIIRGLLLKDTVQDKDFNNVLKPVINVKNPTKGLAQQSNAQK